MLFGRLRSFLRILWRDAIMWVSDATILLDEWMAAYLFADTGYQYIWSKLDVHRTLLDDEVRVEAFRKALEETVKEGDRVLDLGTGTGILAFLAARRGAHVIGADSAGIIDVARKTAEKNKIKNVEFTRSDIRDLDIEPVDCIICELLGMHILDEGITYKVENALRLLKDGGTVIPEKMDIYVAPVESPDAGLGFWRELYGIDYSAVEQVPHEVRNHDMSGSRFLSEPVKAFTIDLKGRTPGRLKWDGTFNMDSAGELHGFVLYFDAKLSENVTLSTHPHKPLTHWKQVFLPVEKRTPVYEGDMVRLELKTAFNNTRWRWSHTLI